MWDGEAIRRRLRELASEDPRLKRFGAAGHRYLLGPALSEAAVRRFENRYRISFPVSYRAFLLGVGDGGAGPYYGLGRHDTEMKFWEGKETGAMYEPDLAKPFPHAQTFRVPAPVPLCAIHPQAVADEEDPCWFNGSIELSELGCGAFARLVVTGPSAGQVWLVDHNEHELLRPGPDFRDWYMAWLREPGPVLR